MANPKGQPRKEKTDTLSIRLRRKTKKALQRIYKGGTLNGVIVEHCETLVRINEDDGN